MPRMFADLHCHPTLYNFNRMRNHVEEDDPGTFHPWTIPSSDLSAMDKGARGATYSQCDVAKLVKSKTRIVFASSTPIEKGFLELHTEDGREHYPFAVELVRILTGQTLLSSGLKLLTEDVQSAANEVTRILKNRGPLRIFLQRAFLKYGLKRIRFMMSDQYDYWQEFLLEYDFWRARDGVTESTRIEHRSGGETFSEEVSGRYQIVRDLDHYDEILETDDEVAWLVTIEGGHVFTIGTDQRRVEDDVIFERIERLKALDHPVLFITLAHHFDNGICGHAHSIPDVAELVMSQKQRLHEGFESEGNLGLRVARELLSVDENHMDTGEPRILIDFKHLSARARQELYDEVIKPYNEKNEHTSERPALPVFMSHAGYSGIGSLDELIQNADKEDDHYHAPPYYAWNINACDEDIRLAHATGGLFGLVFDQRVCGVAPRQKIHDDMWPRVVRAQIFGIVDVIMNDDRLSDDEKRRAWDCVCLGTDYDGMIDPLSRYPTVLQLDLFADDLRAELESAKHTRMIEEIGVDEIVEKVCWKNVHLFARRHLAAAT